MYCENGNIKCYGNAVQEGEEEEKSSRMAATKLVILPVWSGAAASLKGSRATGRTASWPSPPFQDRETPGAGTSCNRQQVIAGGQGRKGQSCQLSDTLV